MLRLGQRSTRPTAPRTDPATTTGPDQEPEAKRLQHNDASSPGRDGRSEARTQGAPRLVSLGAREDTASGRAARPGGTRLIVLEPLSLEDPPGRLRQQISANEPVEVPVQDTLGVARLVLGAVVLDELVRVEDVAADLAAEADVLRRAAFLRQLRLALLDRALDEARLEQPQCGLLVGRLRALVLTLDDDPGRQMRDPDCGIGLVDVLAAGAAGAICVDAKVLLGELDVDVLRDQRADDHLRERRVAAVSLVEGREPDEPVGGALR